jgi:hypothetical protein
MNKEGCAVGRRKFRSILLGRSIYIEKVVNGNSKKFKARSFAGLIN